MDRDDVDARLSAFRERLPELIHDYPPEGPDFRKALAVFAEGFRKHSGEHADYALSELRRFLADSGVSFTE